MRLLPEKEIAVEEIICLLQLRDYW